MNIIQKTALVFTLIGALNWGLVGIFDFDLVAWIAGDMTVFARIIYIVVGLAAVINIVLLFIDLDNPKEIKNRVHD